MPLNQVGSALSSQSDRLHSELISRNVWHRFIEFNESVKTVEQAGKKVQVEKIVKSIVMLDSNGVPLLAIVAAKSKISFRKIKRFLAVKDVRLASPADVLVHSGYPVGGVPPFNKIKQVLVDPQVLRNETAIVGGGDEKTLMEIKTADIVNALNAKIVDISQN